MSTAQVENSYMRRDAVLSHSGEVLAPAKKHMAAAELLEVDPDPTESHPPHGFCNDNVVPSHDTSAHGNPVEKETIAITDGGEFVKEFTISFKVNFSDFDENVQKLITTDKNSFTVEARGAAFPNYKNKIVAWIRTAGGLGPDEDGDGTDHGVYGTDSHGRLVSQELDPLKWYHVEFQKTHDRISLTVDGQRVCSKIDESLTAGINAAKFELEQESGLPTQVKAGHDAGSGDNALRGHLADVSVLVGPAVVEAAATPAVAARPAAGVPATATAAAGGTE